MNYKEHAKKGKGKVGEKTSKIVNNKVQTTNPKPQPPNEILTKAETIDSMPNTQVKLYSKSSMQLPPLTIVRKKANPIIAKPENNQNQELIDTQNQIAKLLEVLDYLANLPDYVPQTNDNEELYLQVTAQKNMESELLKTNESNAQIKYEPKKSDPKVLPIVKKNILNVKKSKEKSSEIAKTPPKSGQLTPTISSKIPKLKSTSEVDKYQDLVIDSRTKTYIERLREAESKIAEMKAQLAFIKKNPDSILQAKESIKVENMPIEQPDNEQVVEQSDNEQVLEQPDNEQVKAELEILQANQEESFEDYAARMNKIRMAKEERKLDPIVEEEIDEQSYEQEEEFAENSNEEVEEETDEEYAEINEDEWEEIPEGSQEIEETKNESTLTNNEPLESDVKIDAQKRRVLINHSMVSLKTIKKEPTVNDLQEIPETSDVDPTMDFEGVGKEIGQQLSATLLCRTIRIGCYTYTPKENLVIESNGILFKIPSITDPNNIKSILLKRKHMIKVLVNFHNSLPVIFFYVVPKFALYVRDQLGMVKGGDYYFDPLSIEQPCKRITVLLENVNDDIKVIFKHIYTKPNNIMDELTTTEANDILSKICPKKLSKVVAGAGYAEIRKILIYPPGLGGIRINTEDYVCLGQHQFLNDAILEFYLKYLVLNLPPELQKKVHVFSTFFYTRLTTKPIKPTKKTHPTEVDSNLTQAQKRHARVKKWTKNVNLFDKDFVVVPINEESHWFLAIICFPGMDGCYTMNGKPYVVKKASKIIKKDISCRLGSEITFTPIKKEKEEKAIPCEDDDASDEDKAESDENELDSGEDSEEPENPESCASEMSTEVATVKPTKRSVRPPIKQPCILIFDSLTGASRVRVVSTLRGYLSCEYKVKMGVDKAFNRETIVWNCPKVPQQTNFTDCGLYLLQYVEQFFKDPIKDYYVPIKHLKNWFDEFDVTKKREDISTLIKELMLTQNGDPNSLPDIAFPTLNGKLVERLPKEEDEEFMEGEFEEEEDEDEEYTLDSSDIPNDSSTTSELQLESDLETNLKNSLPINRSRNQIKINRNQNSSVSEGLSLKDNNTKPLVECPIKKTNASEVVPHSSSQKSKRIISKHNKSADQVDVKRIKLSTE